MKTSGVYFLAAMSASFPTGAHASERPIFDIVTPEKRKLVLDSAARLAKPTSISTLAPSGVNPFDPPGFGQSEPSERASEISALKSLQPAVTRVASDRELLETIASKILPAGTIFVGGEPTLLLGKKAVKIGTRFTVTYLGVDYVLELTAIDRTTFTLRFNREEIIRPIKPGK